ncbi:MAG: histidine kinase dimerization/phosphoacceptor domain -containing protein [Ferruginibacter sp.]
MQNRLNAYGLLLLLYIFCSFFPEQLFSQAVSGNVIVTTRHLNSKDGLAAKLVNCGTTDSTGFVWFGTQHGLQRYDGKNFLLFSKEKNGLQDNNVVQLVEDQHHLLWILYGSPGTDRFSNGKADVIDPNTFQIKTLTEKFGKALPFEEKKLLTIKCNEKNEIILNIYAGTNEVEQWLYTVNNNFRKLYKGSIGGSRYSFFFRDSTLMSGTFDGGLGIVSSGKNPPLIKNDHLVNNAFLPLGITPDHRRFFAEIYGAGLSAGNKKQSPVIMELKDNNTATKISNQLFEKDTIDYSKIILRMSSYNDSRTGSLVIFVENKGLFLFDGENYTQLMDAGQMTANHISWVYDYFTINNNQHWFCTDNGVFVINIKKNLFSHYLSNDVIKLPLATGYQARSVCEHLGKVYIVCWDGFYEVTETDAGQRNYKKVLSADVIGTGEGFYFDGKYFWLNGAYKGLAKFDITKNSVEQIPGTPGGLWAGLNIHNGGMLYGNIGSISVFENDSSRKINFCNGNVNVTAWTYQFFYSHDSTLWAVTSEGLFKIKNNCIAAQYSADVKDPAYKIPFTNLNAVYEDRKGFFWMATNGGGLIKWNRTDNSFQQFTVADGLSSNVLYAVLEDKDGFFWISSEYGLMRFDPVSHSVKTYTSDDGLTENEFNRISYFKAGDGRMFFGGMNGVNAFYPKDFLNDSSEFDAPLRLVLCNQFVGDEDKLVDMTSSLTRTNTITFNPGDKFLTLEFQLLDFGEGTHRYAYKIDGLDKNWNYINENSIRLSGLPYGHYTLHIKGQSQNGKWSSHELTILLVINAPLTSTWWFWCIVIAVLVVTVILFFRWRTQRLVKAKEALEKMVTERTSALKESLSQEQSLLKEKDVLLKEIHHRVKNNLQVISGLLELQGKNLTDDNAKQALMEGRNRVRSMALIHQNLYEYENLSQIELHSFVDDLFKQVSVMFENKSEYTKAKINIPVTEIDIDTAVPFGLVLNELLTNSFKYAFTGSNNCTIEMTLAVENNNEEEGRKFIFTYSDSGPGLPVGFDIKKSKSLGMRLINDLSKQMGGSMHYEFDNGSRFTILFYDKKARKKTID